MQEKDHDSSRLRPVDAGPIEEEPSIEGWSLDSSIPRHIGIAGAQKYVSALRMLGIEPSDAVMEAADLVGLEPETTRE